MISFEVVDDNCDYKGDFKKLQYTKKDAFVAKYVIFG
jgi:hypothetical protein